jgi:hypothetical protein
MAGTTSWWWPGAGRRQDRYLWVEPPPRHEWSLHPSTSGASTQGTALGLFSMREGSTRPVPRVEPPPRGWLEPPPEVPPEVPLARQVPWTFALQFEGFPVPPPEVPPVVPPARKSTQI